MWGCMGEGLGCGGVGVRGWGVGVYGVRGWGVYIYVNTTFMGLVYFLLSCLNITKRFIYELSGR